MSFYQGFLFFCSVIFKNSSAAFVVFDSCNPSTLNCVTEWKEIIDFMVRQKNGDSIPVFLLANKVATYCVYFQFIGTIDSHCGYVQYSYMAIGIG